MFRWKTGFNQNSFIFEFWLKIVRRERWNFPDNKLNEGTTYVRFQSVKQLVGGVAITTLELSTTLNGNISDSATSIILTDGSEFPTAGYIVIEKVYTQADLTAGVITNPLLVGTYANETIQYTGRSTHTLTHGYWILLRINSL